MRNIAIILCILISSAIKSQKIENIYFNLYTDSLKKGVYNYINVDGKLSTGSFLPLTSDEISFWSNAGKWDGNSLIIERNARVDSVLITAVLKARPEVKKSIVIHVKKIEIDPLLKSEQDLIDEWRKKGARRRN